MKKSKLLILGLIALMLAGGLVLASCESDPVCDSCADKCGKAGTGQCSKSACGDKCGNKNYPCPTS